MTESIWSISCLRCVLLTRSFRGQELKIIDLDADPRTPSNVPLPEWCRQITLGANLDFLSDNFCFFISSPIQKTQAFEYNFTTKECLPDPHQVLHGHCLPGFTMDVSIGVVDSVFQ